MEKRTPHCKLAVVKDQVAAGKVRTTVSALAGGAALGFGFEEIVGVVAALTPRDFYRRYDDTRRSPHLAGRLSARRHQPARCPKVDGPGQRADRVLQGAMKKGALL
jgi:hypothetical protein